MQAIDRTEARQYLSSFNFRTFFTELMGWNAVPASSSVKTVDSQQFSFVTVAEKKGYTILLCDRIPPYPVRAKLDRLIARDHFEHILVFADRASNRQIWQVSLREKGHPVKLREVPYRPGASGEELIQKLEQIAVPLEKEESTHLTDLTTAARAAFNERITKRFYRQFELEHKSFLKFLKGIPETVKPWYVSVLINRLMFLYFMQSKSFLDGNPQYLTNKLAESKGRIKDTFYRDFLCPLFFEGFAMRATDRSPAVRKLLGDIPYLNGGLFQKHPIELKAEEDGSTIAIPDIAFEQLFGFFERWTWHLDTNESADGDEIDPDVLGYIFEKYINQMQTKISTAKSNTKQKQMGAYYTQEDITGYIVQNTVLPFLFEGARKGCANAFEPNGAIWRMLRDDPDRYIYAAMRRGNETVGSRIQLKLPADIAAGIDDVSRRTGWNRAIPSEFADSALPAETWREFIGRRQRYLEVRDLISSGTIYEINDLITLNLDIRQLAIDTVQIAGSEDLVESFYKSIEQVTILDPACGSGAFLFAALELLQPLYDACLRRMEGFVDEAQSEAANKGQALHFNRFSHFRKTLDAAARHVNAEYFILKTIIVQNLYGVDIMEEATEICKLRLFLKLVAQIDIKDKDRIEPLPDIDFNIRAGNTLVGYARYDDVKKAAESRLSFGEDAMAIIDDRLRTLDQAVSQFRRQQTELGGSVTAEDKAALNGLYKELEAELDDFLAAERGVKKSVLAKWKQSTKPFHWFCDFHAILAAGGFDIIIGNPPYVEYAKVRSLYSVGDYLTVPSGNLYGMFAERSNKILSENGRFGMIVPLSIICTDRMSSVREIASKGTKWISNFDMRPSALFDGVAQRLTILMRQPGAALQSTFSGGYRRWISVERPYLLQSSRYIKIDVDGLGSIPKLYLPIEETLLSKISGPQLEFEVQESAEPIFVHRIIRYFVKALDHAPAFTAADGSPGRSPDFKPFTFRLKHRIEITAFLNSSLFYWFWRTFSDGFHCGYGDIYRMPFSGQFSTKTSTSLSDLNEKLQADLRNKSVRKTIRTQAGSITYQEFYPKESKHIIDAIDRVLAQHYGFTDEELDCVVNYDIKYRMGRDANEGDLEANS